MSIVPLEVAENFSYSIANHIWLRSKIAKTVANVTNSVELKLLHNHTHTYIH